MGESLTHRERTLGTCIEITLLFFWWAFVVVHTPQQLVDETIQCQPSSSRFWNLEKFNNYGILFQLDNFYGLKLYIDRTIHFYFIEDNLIQFFFHLLVEVF